MAVRPGIEQRTALEIARQIDSDSKQYYQLEDRIYMDTLKYRIQAVKEALDKARNISLDNMKSKCSSETQALAREMDNLIVFCSNKLNGNTDCLEVLLNGK